MGEQRKIINAWRFGILSILLVLAFAIMSIGLCLVNPHKVVARVTNLTTSDGETTQTNNTIVRYWGTEDGIRSKGFAQQDDKTKTCNIRTQGELAYVSYALARSAKTNEDYSGYTFILENDIDLHAVDSQNKVEDEVYPLWTPIDVGTLGKNKNITFKSRDGNNFKITGMHIKYENTTTPYNAGFFANIIGGVIENVTFVDPVIEYTYTGTSISKDDPNRPSTPTDICVGVIAGAADSTYINNVNIDNPTIKFTTENTNAHNFYVGTAVGKLSFTAVFEDVVDKQGNAVLDEENHKVKKRVSINTASPTQWGLDTINVTKNGNVSMIIKQGNDAGTTYGQATYGYLGGLVGANISSKVINSTLRVFNVTPQINDDIEGTYYVGGLAGLTTQITTAEELAVASGLYNNLLYDVNLGKIQTSVVRYCGNLVGRVYAGGLIYDNMVIGNTDKMPYDQLWGKVDNSFMFVDRYDEDDENHIDNCLGYINGALDQYYFREDNYSISESKCYYAATDINNTYLYCQNHQKFVILNVGNDAYGTEDVMKKYNFTFESTAERDGEGKYTKYHDFVKNDVKGNNGASLGYTQLGLMSALDKDYGVFYAMSKPILRYELGLTVNEVDPYTNQAIKDEDMLYGAVYQFRSWKTDSSGEPLLGDYFGTVFSVVFESNSPKKPDSEAYFEETLPDGSIRKTTQKIITRTFQQFIVEPEESQRPKCEGYNFIGWLPDWDYDGVNKKENGCYIFNKERITGNGIRFIALWDIRDVTAHYMEREGVSFSAMQTETVKYASPLVGPDPDNPPTSNQGLVFAGWYLKADLPTNGQDADQTKQWVFGHNGNKMPGEDIYLYAGWVDNFTMLRRLLDDAEYIKYYTNYAAYFDDNLGAAYHAAYASAYIARRDGDASNANALLSALQGTFAALRVDPKKLLNLQAFDETLLENTCPFLYDYNAYLNYVTFKEIIEKYANAEADETILKNIDGFIKYYEKLNELFDALDDNLKSSVVAAGGINSKEIVDLIRKYEELENRYEALYEKGEYAKYNTTTLDNAEKLAKQRWTEINRDLVLKDVELVVADYETAFNNLQPKTAAEIAQERKPDGSSQTGISPVALGIIIVVILAVGVGGYIGVDVVLTKRRYGTKSENTNTQQTPPEEETYI